MFVQGAGIVSKAAPNLAEKVPDPSFVTLLKRNTTAINILS